MPVAALSHRFQRLELNHSAGKRGRALRGTEAVRQMCSAFATREKSGEITPACVRWLGRDVREAPTTKERDFIFGAGLLM